MGEAPFQEYSWVYLGKDILQSVSIGKVLGEGSRRISIADLLQKNADHYRIQYVEFIGSHAQNHPPMSWYLTSLSEKNPYISDFFLHFCYLVTAISIVRDTPGSMVIICEDGAVQVALCDNLRDHKDIRLESFNPKAHVVINDLILLSRKIRIKSFFLMKFFYRIAVARTFAIFRRRKEQGNNQPVILMHSWADHRSFGPAREYRDVYLGAIGTILERKVRQKNAAVQILYLIDILPTIGYINAVKSLHASKVDHFLLEDMISIRDLLSSLFLVNRELLKVQTPEELDLFNVDALIKNEIRRDQISFRAEQSFLCYKAVEKICRRMEVRSFIYTFENHIWEKMFLLGFRQYSPCTGLYGYAHATVNRMETCYSMSPEESGTHPLPDIIFVNGTRSKKILVESGFRNVPVSIVGSLRYPNISDQTTPENSNNESIIIALSADYYKSLELVFKATKAFGSDKDYDIIIKPHPTMMANRIEKHLSPELTHFVISTAPAGDLLKTCGVLFYSDSTIAIEAAIQNIPVVHVKSDYTIDINVLDNQCEIPSVSDPRSMQRLATLFMREKRGFSRIIRDEIMDEYMAPINEDVLDIVIQSGQQNKRPDT